MISTGKRVSRALMILALSGGLFACTPIMSNHGYVPNDRELAAIDVGVDTRDTVAVEFGRPSSSGLLTDEAWYYVRSRFRQFGPARPVEINREVVAVSFDTAGRVSNIERFGLEDGQVIVLSRRVTDSNVQGISFLQQLLGNVGRVSADQFIQ